MFYFSGPEPVVCKILTSLSVDYIHFSILDSGAGLLYLLTLQDDEVIRVRGQEVTA